MTDYKQLCESLMRMYELHNWDWAKDYANAIEELQAENERLKKQLDAAVILPCNVGDTVYFMACGEMKSAEILAMKVNISGDDRINFEGYFQLGMYVMCWVIGESLFTTEEQAKRAYIGVRECGEDGKE